MTNELKRETEGQSQLIQLLQSLQKISTDQQSGAERLDGIMQEACTLIGCDHLFLSRYDSKNKLFKMLSWCSSMQPSEVSLDKKFMGEQYINNQQVIINDLSQYNYRLTPAVARQGLLSMAGIPLIMDEKLAGVLEAFSVKLDYFSETNVLFLGLFARELIMALERTDREREYKYLAAETDFLCGILKLEQASLGSLLYKLGETFASLLNLDGIAVFGLEEGAADNALQEVMAQGFSMADIGRLKQNFHSGFLNSLEIFAKNDSGPSIIKQSLSVPDSTDAKLLYIIPVTWQNMLSGVAVFYWQQASQETEWVILEQFVKKIINHLSLVLGRKSVYRNIQRISFTDSLTDLANRRVFDYVLAREFKKTQRSLKPISLLMIDIDYFKQVNDNYGHLAGDAILEQLGFRLKESFRSVDMVARYGGEEFAIILPETDGDAARLIADRFRADVVATPFEVNGQLINLTISIGIAAYAGNSTKMQNRDVLLQSADYALYQAKKLGRNLVILANNS